MKREEEKTTINKMRGSWGGVRRRVAGRMRRNSIWGGENKGGVRGGKVYSQF